MASMTLFADRISAAVESGIIDVDWDDWQEDGIAITAGELAMILHVLLPEEHPQLQSPAAPTHAAPGTAKKIAEMQMRLAAGESLWHRADCGGMERARGTILRGGSGAVKNGVKMIRIEEG